MYSGYWLDGGEFILAGEGIRAGGPPTAVPMAGDPILSGYPIAMGAAGDPILSGYPIAMGAAGDPILSGYPIAIGAAGEPSLVEIVAPPIAPGDGMRAGGTSIVEVPIMLPGDPTLPG